MKTIRYWLWGILLILCLPPQHARAITRATTYHSSTLSTATNSESVVETHTAERTITTPIDYVITGETASSAITANLYLANDAAAVVFRNIKPSNIISQVEKYIKINGEAAKNGTNCRVDIYRHGSIVLPYGDACHPLTTYKGTSQTGESKSDWNINDYYTSLGEWDNAIQSFTLKRGYMVTMANHSDGTGYSHCFIADRGDITVTLPADMLQSVSFLRIFQWRWPSKKGYAGKDLTPMGLMNVTWFYQWNSETNDYDNYDYTPQRHHETGNSNGGEYKWRWPEWSNINNKPYAHVLGMNEPDNTSGSNEIYMSVSDLINHHKEYLTSGMRIGTFACTNPRSSWVEEYVSLCEARNYRVDFVATHYYLGGQSPAACINSLKALYTATNLPVWVTEWNNGANWTSETGFTTDSLGSYTWGSGDDKAMNGVWLRDVLKRADLSENREWLERLAVYNDVETKRYVHWITDSHWTTSGGALYGSYRSGFAYSKTVDVWMDWQTQGDPNGLGGGFSLDGSNISLTWNEPNGDWIKTIYIEQNTSGSTWTRRATLGVSEDESRSATLTTAECSGTKKFRIHTVDPTGTHHYSNTLDLSSNTPPNGLLKLTSIPSNYEDYYYMMYSKAAATSLCWTVANANVAADYTANVGTAKANWTGASGTTTGNGISLVELYSSSAAGTKMSQVVSGLPAGKYTAVLYATSHNARGENGATLNGTRDDVAYVFATSSGVTKKTYFTASGITPGFLTGEPHECTISDINVCNGSMTLGLGLDEANVTGWHTIQIKSLTRTGDTDDYTGCIGNAKANWTGASGTTTGNGISLVELYSSSAAGEKMYQDVTSLPSGLYDIVLYATSHNARGENGATLNGTRDDVAYCFASVDGGTPQKTYFTASGITPGFITGEPHEVTLSGVRVPTGSTLRVGLGLDEANITGWHTIQIKSLTRTGDIPGESVILSTGKAIHYAAPSSIGTNPGQMWQMERNGDGYALRSPAYYDYVIQGAYAQTDGSTHMAGNSCYLPEYTSGSDYWTMKYVTGNTYVGLAGATPTSGDEVTADNTEANADELYLYAIPKVDFNQVYMVDEGNTDALHLLRNPYFTWGTYESPVQGSNHNYVPNGWTFNKTFAGWNDTNVNGSATIEGKSQKVVNVWAGTFTYAELAQDVKYLPNGVYRLKGYLATTNGYSRTTTRTAFYCNAGTGNIARSYNAVGTGDNAFSPYECYALVTGNRMTIGVRSDGTWFKVSPMTLEYICAEDEATEAVLGYLDNGRALQKWCWEMGNLWLDLSAYTDCRNLQIDMTQPNALVKVASADCYDATYNDHNVIAGGTCENLTLTDANALEIREDFTATSATYSRTMPTNGETKSRWGTLIVPMPLHGDDDVTYYRMTHVGDGQMRFNSIDTDIDANTPVVFRVSEGTETLTLDASGTITRTTASQTDLTAAPNWTMTGAYAATTLTAGQSDYYIAKDKFWGTTTNDVSLSPFRAWFTTAGGNAKSFRIFVDDTPDAIEQLREDRTNGTPQNSKCHDLQGRRVYQPQKGVYILNNRKLVVK